MKLADRSALITGASQGFGLAVVKRMTEALGGTVTFESEIGIGTKFNICLPLKRIRR